MYVALLGNGWTPFQLPLDFFPGINSVSLVDGRPKKLVSLHMLHGLFCLLCAYEKRQTGNRRVNTPAKNYCISFLPKTIPTFIVPRFWFHDAFLKAFRNTFNIFPISVISWSEARPDSKEAIGEEKKRNEKKKSKAIAKKEERQTDPVLAGRQGKEIWEWNNSANGVAHFKEAKVQNKMASSSGSMIEVLRFEWSTLILYLGDGCQKWSFGFVRRWRLVLNLIFVLKSHTRETDWWWLVYRQATCRGWQIYCRLNFSILILSDPQK